MDPYLLGQALRTHGNDFMEALKREQGENKIRGLANFASNVAKTGSLSTAPLTNPSRNDDDVKNLLVSFIAKKADMLYVAQKSNVIPVTSESEDQDYSAILPPLETFMFIPADDRKKYFFECLEVGDAIIGTVSSKMLGSLVIEILCVSQGKRRQIDDLAIKAVCSVANIEPVAAHIDPLDDYHVGDLVQGIVIEINLEDERIELSFHESVISDRHGKNLKLGPISDDDLPYHYRVGRKVNNQLCEDVLKDTLGFMNPSSVSHLAKIMGLNLESAPSLMRGLQNAKYPIEESAAHLYKVQSAKWAYKSVMEGVRHLKEGNNTEAFQCLNKALQIDPQNVEALVARGALYANNSSFERALDNFELALHIDPDHANALKFALETFVALGKQYEEHDRPEDAIKCYRRALKLNPSYSDAITSIKHSEEKEKARQLVECALNSDKDFKKRTKPETDNVSMKEKLKMLLKEEKHKKERKNKKRRHTSSSSSSPSSSSSSSITYSSSSESTSTDSTSGSSQSVKILSSRTASRPQRSYSHSSSEETNLKRRSSTSSENKDKFQWPKYGSSKSFSEESEKLTNQKSAAATSSAQAKPHDTLPRKDHEDERYLGQQKTEFGLSMVRDRSKCNTAKGGLAGKQSKDLRCEESLPSGQRRNSESKLNVDSRTRSSSSLSTSSPPIVDVQWSTSAAKPRTSCDEEPQVLGSASRKDDNSSVSHGSSEAARASAVDVGGQACASKRKNEETLEEMESFLQMLKAQKKTEIKTTKVVKKTTLW